MTTITLLDGVALHAAHPATFHIPSQSEKAGVRVGDHVKIGFTDGMHTERMWVLVIDEGCGILDNDPVILSMKDGDAVRFEPRHLLAILAEPRHLH